MFVKILHGDSREGLYECTRLFFEPEISEPASVGCAAPPPVSRLTLERADGAITLNFPKTGQHRAYVMNDNGQTIDSYQL